MEPRDAVLAVLREAGEPLHWTVVQDRALRAGHLDPFLVPDVRGGVLAALRDLASEGTLERRGKGVYAITGDTRSG